MGQLTFTISPWKPLISPPIPTTNLAFTVPSTSIPLKLSTFSCLSSSKIPRSARTAAAAVNFRVSGIPARDRVVDFGKYKGKMLGSLPSAYLKWVSKNLRAGDTEEWAKMADEVLDDPVYRDRVEWEAAEKILNGDTAGHCSNGDGRNAVTELLEISERFGWDNEDKRGWSRIDFELLGTSKGGRIPRVAADRSNDSGVGILKKKTKGENEVEGRGRRRERARRLSGKTINGGGGWATERIMGEQREEEEEGGASSPAEGGVVRSPFPGREALLKKVLNRQGLKPYL
ncbi:hypothetical protein ACS0TY_036406 [Phlomoides rotata]